MNILDLFAFGLFTGLFPKTHREAFLATNSPVKISYLWVIPLVVVIEEAGKDLNHWERFPVNIKFRSTVKRMEFWDIGSALRKQTFMGRIFKQYRMLLRSYGQ